MTSAGRVADQPLGSSPPAVPSGQTRPLARLDRAEWKRRLWHMLPGLLPPLLWLFPHRDPISPTLQWIVVALAAGLALVVFMGYRRIARRKDRQRLAAILGYALSVLLMVIFFPADLELGLAVLMILAFGDGSATLFGKLLRSPALGWNQQKTWAGFLAFVALGGASAALVYWGETYFNPESANPVRSLGAVLAVGFLPALLAGVAESLPVRLNDNIRVGAAAAAGVIVVHGLLTGWF